MKWTRCSKEFPPINERVLLLMNDEIEVGKLVDTNEDSRLRAKHKDRYPVNLQWRIGNSEYLHDLDDVTHWMTAPKKPEEVVIIHGLAYPTSEELICAKVIKNRVLFFFESSIWELVPDKELIRENSLKWVSINGFTVS